MARHTKLEVLNAVHEIGVVPVFYNGDIDKAQNIARACVSGGIRVLEFTNRGDHAWEVFSTLDKFCASELPDAILGAGSVLDAGTASIYISNGASFIVGPVTNPDVARVCNRRKAPYIPGCGTASEISAAEELGADIVKIFPGSAVGGPGFVKDVFGAHAVVIDHAHWRRRYHRSIPTSLVRSRSVRGGDGFTARFERRRDQWRLEDA